MRFVEFKKIPRLSRDIIISEKIDGCFDYKSRILTDKGYISIGKIVNQKLNYKVLSYNFDKKQFEMVKILNWFKKPSNYKEFLHIKLRGFKQGAAYYSFRCTPNHLILTKNGYIRADKLKITDKVCSPNNPLTFIQQQMLLGTLLGDATIRKLNDVSFSYSHAQSIKHKDYSMLIKKLLSRFFISERILKGGYANTDITHIQSNFDIELQSYLKKIHINGKKQFSYKLLCDLSPIALAFWYMDDGSSAFTKEQNPRLTLHTQGFSESQIDIFIRLFKNKFNLYPQKKNYGKGFQLTFNSIDTNKFFDLVAPYINDDLQYKLPPLYRTGKCYWDNYQEDCSIFYEQEILEIKPNTTSGLDFHYKYDIETENHNYIVSGIVVHNSNGQVVIMTKMKIMFECEKCDYTSDDFIEKFCLYIHPENPHVEEKDKLYLFAASRNRWLTTGKQNDNHAFAYWVQEHGAELVMLGEGRHFGEWMGKGIQRGYGLEEKRFYLFNVSKWAKKNFECTPPLAEKQEYCPDCCEVVPILYEGAFDTVKIDQILNLLKVGGSVAVNHYMNPEGICIYHTAAGQYFKKTIEGDDKPKGVTNG